MEDGILVEEEAVVVGAHEGNITSNGKRLRKAPLSTQGRSFLGVREQNPINPPRHSTYDCSIEFAIKICRLALARTSTLDRFIKFRDKIRYEL